ncbi:DUF1772 domain-containing protein [Pendulispora albinea]|uniref:DUF1772 domain-containing protein n=1 Tax=Pendulispora albinea TaxID=2741071 RepID=A0ABZ2LP99_9BACT
MAGVFFAFSTFVMAGLGSVQPARGIAAMQGINQQAPTAWFMTALFGTALLCTILGVRSGLHLGEAGAVYRVAGCAMYLVAIVLTIVYHVPRNGALAALDPASAEAATYWQYYLTNWTAWNHLRTIASFGAAILLTLGLNK